MNVTGLKVEREEDLPEIMERFLTCKGPVILDAIVRTLMPHINVYIFWNHFLTDVI